MQKDTELIRDYLKHILKHMPPLEKVVIFVETCRLKQTDIWFEQN